MQKLTVLITGANSGFGKRIAITFAQAGYHVYAAVRNMESEGVNEITTIVQKEQLSLEWLKIDITKQEQIVEAFTIIKNKGGLDILINNAGFGILGPIEEYSVNDVQKQFDTNFFGVVRMIYIFLPLLKKSNVPKIITISSIAGLIVAPAYGLYASSKHAVEVFVEALRYELFNSKIKIALIEPGGFDTNFTINAPGLTNNPRVPMSAHWYQKIVSIRNKHIGIENNIINKKRDPQLVANLALSIAKQKNPRLHNIIGQGATISYIMRKIIPQEIWEFIMKIVLKYLSRQ